MSQVPRDDKKDLLVNFRVSPAEKALWQREADRQDVPLSRMIRHVVTEYCRRQKNLKK